MGRRREQSLACLFLLLLTVAGCVTSGSTSCCHQDEQRGPTHPDQMPACERGRFPIELLASPSSPALPAADLPVQRYYQLLAQDAQCLAVKAAPIANLLDEEAKGAQQQAPPRKHHKQGKDGEVQSQVTALVALEDRNRSAALALAVYFQLGEAEAKQDIVQSMLTEVHNSLIKVREMKRKGLDVPTDDTALYRQELDLQTGAIRLKVLIQTLNSELRRHLGFEGCEQEAFAWPVDAFQLCTTPVDRQEAVAVGLHYRADLQALRVLERALSEGKVEEVRLLLRALNGMLGQSPRVPLCPCLMKIILLFCTTAAQEAEQQTRTEQIAQLRAQRERDVAEEISLAVQIVHEQIRVLHLAQLRAESWRERKAELEEKESKGIISFGPVTEAKLELLQAQRSVVEEATNLQRAWVKLRQSQGLLAAACLPSAQPVCGCSSSSILIPGAADHPAPVHSEESLAPLVSPLWESSPRPHPASEVFAAPSPPPPFRAMPSSDGTPVSSRGR
jgi:hypothetical protein